MKGDSTTLLLAVSVNLASRLCSSAKDQEILVDQVLARNANSNARRLQPLGERPIKGYDEPVPVFRVMR